jgi:hypothetical protein
MAGKEMQNLAGLIVGTLKIIEPTDKRDSSKRVIWRAECVCGERVTFAKPDLEKYAGHSECTGHPVPQKQLEGFHLLPASKDTPEHVAAVAAWELRRHTEQPKDATNMPLSTEGSEVLRSRLGLNGYRCETVALPQAVTVSSGHVEKVVFAKSLTTEDRVFLHVQLVNKYGRRSIVSSRKKMPENDWSEIANILEGINIKWREKDTKRGGRTSVRFPN